MATSDDTPAGGLSPSVSPTVRSRGEAGTATDEPSATETYALALGALGAALMTLAVDHHGPVTVLMLTVALMPWAMVAGGIRVPTWLFVAWTLAPAVEILAAEHAGGPIFLGVLTATRVFSLSGSWATRTATIAAVLVLPVVLVLVSDDSFAEDPGPAYFTAGIGVGALSGHLFHRQRELTARLRWSLARLDAAAAADERRRIAREVHDLVAHSLTVVMLNVSGARKALATHPHLVAEALDRAEDVGRESLDGIRRVVSLLRSDDEHAAEPPQPTAHELPAVVEQQRKAGADVTLDVSGNLATLEPVTGAALVRITQEALTNAQRHAPGAPISVRVTATRERITLDVHNRPATRPPLDTNGERQGLGLLGMRERVEALGGRFTAGPAGDGWTLTAEIPLAPATGAGASAPGASADGSAAAGEPTGDASAAGASAAGDPAGGGPR